jgi:two-component system OmpR family response regulator
VQPARAIGAGARRPAAPGRSPSPVVGGCYQFAGWSFDPRRRELRSPGGVGMALSSGEFRLLTAFVERPLRVLTRDQLLDIARGPTPTFTTAPSTCRSAASARSSPDKGGGDLIVTVRSEGYMFAVRPVLR